MISHRKVSLAPRPCLTQLLHAYRRVPNSSLHVHPIRNRPSVSYGRVASFLRCRPRMGQIFFSLFVDRRFSRSISLGIRGATGRKFEIFVFCFLCGSLLSRRCLCKRRRVSLVFPLLKFQPFPREPQETGDAVNGRRVLGLRLVFPGLPSSGNT